jgi:hypothetical protein
MASDRFNEPRLSDRLWGRWKASSGQSYYPSPEPVDSEAFPLSKITLTSCAVVTVLIGLFIIAAICFHILEGSRHPIVEAVMLAVIVLWAGIARATSEINLLYKAGHLAVILYPFLFFLGYQTVGGFWLTYFVLVAIVFDEHRHRLDDEPIHTKIAQTVTVLFVMAHLLLWFTEHFLPRIQATLRDNFDYLYEFLRLRQILGITIGSIILYATAIQTIHRFRTFEWREYKISPRVPEIIADAVRELVYYVGNFFRIIGIAFVTVLREAIIYTWKTFFSAPLWRTIFYIAATAAVSALLVGDVLFMQSYLTEVLRNTHPFFAPTVHLLWSYLIVLGSFAAAAAGVAALTWLRLSRTAPGAKRHPAYKKLTLTSSAIVICIWIAAFTAWVLNTIFHLNDDQFITLGYFTCLALIFAIRAAITAFRSGELSTPPKESAT